MTMGDLHLPWATAHGAVLHIRLASSSTGVNQNFDRFAAVGAVGLEGVGHAGVSPSRGVGRESG